ncbi:hypothetical protein [Spirosoma koreense]
MMPIESQAEFDRQIEREKDTNAFPQDIGEGMPQFGLTKREYFAAKALQGLLTQSGALQGNTVWVTALAVTYADTLIRQLNRVNPIADSG